MPRRRLAPLHSLLLVLGVLLASAVAAVSLPQAAHASVVAGDVVFVRTVPGDNPYEIMKRASNGALTNLSTGSTDNDYTPSISPDGSRLAFIGKRPYDDDPQNKGSALVVMNSDGSGQSIVLGASSNPYREAFLPAWSPDGSKLAFVEYAGSGRYIAVVNVDGTGYQRLTTSGNETNPTWSPTAVSGHYRIAYESDDPNTLQGSIYIVRDDAVGSPVLVTAAGSNSSMMAPVWSPSGNRIYVLSNGFAYYNSTTGFTSGTPTWVQLNSTGAGQTADPGFNYRFSLSPDGATLAYATQGTGCTQLWTVSANTVNAAPAALTNNSACGFQDYAPTYVPAAWPPAPPSSSIVSVSAPSPSDAPYTRKITINLSTTGVSKFQFGWSTSRTTAPNTSYLQQSTDLATKKGTLNYLGKYSGSGTTWNGGTQPDQDWYMWVRTVQTGGTANAWNGGCTNCALKVRTPRRPVWVGVGDSTSSGHHQTTDEPGCAEEAPWPFTCEPADLVPNDASYSWVSSAASKVNTSLHVPSGWQTQPVVVAKSGQATSEFGNGTFASNPSEWASTGQAGRASVELYSRYNSWNVVSMTGGANDTNWYDVMRQWYIDNFSNGKEPWDVSTVLECPNTEAVWQTLQSASLTASIAANLQGIVEVAAAASPGVRVLNLNYPYVVDYGTQSTGNPCYSDWNINGTDYRGVKSVVDALNAARAAVTGARVKNVDVKSAFGVNTTVSGGYLQLTRIYGYPHPSGGPSGGQNRMADQASSVLTGPGW